MILSENLYRDVAYLCDKIGVRLAGSEQEKEAAEYIKTRMQEYVPDCEIETFDCKCCQVEREDLQVLVDGQWKKYDAILFNGAPGTKGETIEAEPVYFDSHQDYQRKDISFVTGKAVIHWGLRFGSEENYRRMIQAKPACLLMVDTRYTSDIPLGDGMYPAYVKACGAIPTVNVAFYDAWEMIAKKAEKIRLTVVGEAVPSKSYNVIATIPGTLQEPLCFYAGGHLDTQSRTVGADDNAIGCAVMVELARVLSQKKLRHTVKLIAFGAEEQLSAGSSAYVRRHREEIEQYGCFMWNFDSCASAVGWNNFWINANDTLYKELTDCYHARELYYNEIRGVEPTIDLFPLTACGVPGISMHRRNCETGTFFHHRPGNAPENISTDIAAQIANAALDLIERLDNEEFDGKFSLDSKLVQQVKDSWEETFGGWE